jgi:hypothetical protein
MKRELWMAMPLVVIFLFAATICQAEDLPGICRLNPVSTGSRTAPALDSAQPDTLYYDGGIPEYFFVARNIWTRLRFTAQTELQLRTVYFVANNVSSVTSPCSIFVYLGNGGNPGLLLGGYRMPGIVTHFGTDNLNPIWNSFDLPTPLTFQANQDFYICIGLQPGGNFDQGWHVLLDDANSGRSAYSSSGREGLYNSMPYTFLIRAGVGPVPSGGNGYVSLISAGPPSWQYELHVLHGALTEFTLSDLCPGTIGDVSGLAQEFGWTATSHDLAVVFSTPYAYGPGALATFTLSHPTCSDMIAWQVGDSSGGVDGPLPVELASFSAENSSGSVLIRFATASENNNANFEIYRGASRDGNFSLLTRIASHGNSSTQQTYEFRDSEVVEGQTYWYYLADVNLSGERVRHTDLMRSASVSAAAIPEDFTMSAYPNPFNPATTIRFTLPAAERVCIQIYDATGRLIENLADQRFDAGRHQVTFDAAALPSGIYLARATAGSTSLTSKLLLVK